MFLGPLLFLLTGGCSWIEIYKKSDIRNEQKLQITTYQILFHISSNNKKVTETLIKVCLSFRKIVLQNHRMTYQTVFVNHLKDS